VPELQLDQIQNNAKCPSVWWGSSCVFEGWGSSDCRPDLALRSQMLMSQLYIWLDMADIRRRLAAHIPEARKALLLTEIDRVGQVNPNFSTVLDTLLYALIIVPSELEQDLQRVLFWTIVSRVSSLVSLWPFGNPSLPISIFRRFYYCVEVWVMKG
jgi:hypothetical protein